MTEQSNKWPKIISWLLKLGGLVIMSIGFYIRNADQFPIVMNRICKNTVLAETAINKLKKGGQLNSLDEGFNELADLIYKDTSVKGNSGTNASNYFNVVAFKLGQLNIEKWKQPQLDVIIMLSMKNNSQMQDGNNGLKYELDFFENKILEIKQAELIHYGLFLFWIGLLIEIVALAIDFIAHISLFQKRDSKVDAHRCGEKNDESMPY